MSTIANLEARYSANIIQFDTELKRLQNLNRKATDKILNDQRGAVRDVNQAWSKADLGGSLNRSLGNGLGALRTQLIGSIAAIVSGAGVAAAVGLAETYTRFSNSLKVAGLEGANLKAVQDRLFDVANRNGVAVETLGQLYGRMNMSAKALGASQTDLLNVVEAVASAMKISGRPASEAAGAITQMSQAFAGGKVRAEEWGSIVEGMPALAIAIAAASEKYRGNVGLLKADVDKGNFSSKEMIRLMLIAKDALGVQAAKATETAAQGFEVLKNKMVEAVGTTNEAWGVTERLGEALKWLGENLDTVGSALGVIAIAMAATLAPAVGRAAIAITGNTVAMVANGVAAVRAVPAQLAFAAALNGTTRAAAAATFGLRLMMTATGIGLAITAVSIALGVFAAQSYKAAEASRDAAHYINEKKAALDAAKAAADKARVETGNLSAAEMAALTKTASLTGQVDLLSTAYGRLAVEAKRARLEILATEAAKATQARRTVQETFDRELAAERRRAIRPGITQNGRMDGGYSNRTPEQVEAEVRRRMSGRESVTNLRNGREVEAAAYNEYNRNRDAKAETFLAPTVADPVTRSASKGGSGGSGGTSAEQRADNDRDAEAAAQRALRDAVRAQAYTAAERHTVSLASLEDDKAMAVLAIRQRVADEEISAATGEKLIELTNQTNEARVQAVVASRSRELEEAALELKQFRNDNALEAARLDAEELSDKAQLATSMEDRHNYERQVLAAQQRADTLMFNAEQEALKLQLEKNGHAQAEIDQIVADRQATFARRQAGQVSNQAASQDKENGPGSLQEWITGFAQAEAGGQSFNQTLFDIAEGGISSITSGLTQAIMGAKSFGEAFGDMAKGVVAALIEMGIKFLIFEMLGRAFGMPGLGRAAIGMKKEGGFAAGTDRVGKGGIYEVGEKGKELVALPGGSQVLPNNLLRNAAKVPTGAGVSSPSIVNQIRVDATDAVLSQQVHEWIFDGVTKGMKVSQAMINDQNSKAAANRLGGRR